MPLAMLDFNLLISGRPISGAGITDEFPGAVSNSGSSAPANTVAADAVHFRDLLDCLPVAVARLDPQLRMLFLNRRLADSLGVTEADALGHNCLELGMSPANWGHWSPVAKRAFETGAPAEFEYLAMHGDAEHFVQYRFAPEFGADGTVVTLLIAAFTNDEVHRVRTALAASEQRFGSFMNALPMIAWLRDEADRYVYVNPHYCRVMQLARKENDKARNASSRHSIEPSDAKSVAR